MIQQSFVPMIPLEICPLRITLRCIVTQRYLFCPFPLKFGVHVITFQRILKKKNNCFKLFTYCNFLLLKKWEKILALILKVAGIPSGLKGPWCTIIPVETTWREVITEQLAQLLAALSGETIFSRDSQESNYEMSLQCLFSPMCEIFLRVRFYYVLKKRTHDHFLLELIHIEQALPFIIKEINVERKPYFTGQHPK